MINFLGEIPTNILFNKTFTFENWKRAQKIFFESRFSRDWNKLMLYLFGKKKYRLTNILLLFSKVYEKLPYNQPSSHMQFIIVFKEHTTHTVLVIPAQGYRVNSFNGFIQNIYIWSYTAQFWLAKLNAYGHIDRVGTLINFWQSLSP